MTSFVKEELIPCSNENRRVGTSISFWSFHFPSTNMMSPTPSVSGTLSKSQLIQHARCINEGILIFRAYPLPGLQVLPELQTEGLLKSIAPLVG